ncbi:hypothetical protein [Bradyrhizobium sp. sGM-13]|uniref:hypothetical protein n=1 Tax=Bradyrhizobium sp. sGM-13 TaxID=2831781 RepID=UPI001BCFD96C|nr:hypothetical protein [Bradyrhizobium sp. sGM-13]
MKALIALIAAIAGVAVTLAHLKEGVLHFHLPKDLTWTTAGTLLFSVIALVIGLAHLRHSIKVLMQRNVICAALVVVFAVSLLSLVVGGAWLFGMIFIDAFRSEKHIVLVLSSVWGGGALTLASLFILGAIGEKYSPVGWVGANDNRDPNAPARGRYLSQSENIRALRPTSACADDEVCV